MRIDLEERRIETYDSMPEHTRRLNVINPLSVIIPWLIRMKVDEKYETTPFSYSKVSCPEQVNGLAFE